MRALAAALLLVTALVPAGAGAVDREDEAATAALIELTQARQRIAAADFAAAEVLLLQARGRTPEAPDVHSLLGFCARKQGRLDEAYAHYEVALRLDPDHRGAREYLGELFLQRGQPEHAQAQLAELERLCPTGCEERAELAAAIAAFAAAR
jgi:Tfp pilus assembly protein PilF